LMLEYLLLILAGCLVGLITGLTPGVHVNTVCLIGLSLYAALGVDAVGFGVFMIALAVTQHFIDFIPAIFLGVPDEGTALSILPTHRLLLEGRSLEAVKLTGYGCLLGIVFAVAFLLPALVVIPIVYHWLRGFIVWVLLAALCFLIWREGGWGRVWALVVFLVSGALGIVALNFDAISSSDVLFPVFSGLFGLSGILYSLREKWKPTPQLEYARVEVDRGLLGSAASGAFGGMVVGVLPGMSPSQIGIIMSSLFGTSLRGFLVALAATNTSDTMYSLMSLYTIQNARSGVAVMLGRIMVLDYNTLVLFCGAFCVSSGIGFTLHMWVGRRASRLFSLIDYRLVSCSVLLLVLSLVWLITGWWGLLVCFIATAVGLLPILGGVSRTHLMGVLLVPTILFYLGVG
jgi:putative membrane protein